MDSNLLAQLKQWLQQHAGINGAQGPQGPVGPNLPNGQQGQSPWMGQQAGNGQVMQDSMRQAFNYPK
jgi:hypothetical protein